MISFHTDQKLGLSEKNGIENTKILTFRNIFISKQIWEQIEKHVEEIVAVVMI